MLSAVSEFRKSIYDYYLRYNNNKLNYIKNENIL